MSIHIHVEGEPAPQGSKSPRGRRKNGSVILVESSKKVKPWRAVVTAAALAAVTGYANRPPYGKHRAVRVVGWVVMRRPASVPMRVRRYPVTTPDLDKVLRSIGDALTGVVYHDDAQVVGYAVEARYHDDPDVAHLGLEEGASIDVTLLPGE